MKFEEKELFIKFLIKKAMLLAGSGKINKVFKNKSHALPSNTGKDLEIRYKDLEKDSHINHIGLA